MPRPRSSARQVSTPISFSDASVAWPIGFCQALNSAQSPRMVTTISSGKRAILQRQRVDAVADAAGLKEKRPTLAAEPCAGEIADAFLFRGQDDGVDLLVGLGEANGRRMAGIGDIDHCFTSWAFRHGRRRRCQFTSNYDPALPPFYSPTDDRKIILPNYCTECSVKRLAIFSGDMPLVSSLTPEPRLNPVFSSMAPLPSR